MLKLLNKYKKWLIIFSFVYTYIILMLIAPSGFVALTPGGISETNHQYQIENVSFNNDINTVSVFSWSKLTTFQKWLIEKNDKYDVYKETESYKDLSMSDRRKQGNISHESSQDNAIITAYYYANLEDNKITIDYTLDSLTVYHSNTNKLKVGDVIKEINDVKITSNSYEEFLKNANVFDYLRPSVIKSKDNYTIKIIRDTKEQVVNLSSSEVVQYFPKYNINSSSPSYQGFNKELNVGGPSGGAMQTLSIYSALTNVSFGKLKIAGTGTIEINDSFKVGEIGGLVQKFYTVKHAKVDHFIIPKSQYKEISHLISEATFEIHQVETFSDVIEFARKYQVN